MKKHCYIFAIFILFVGLWTCKENDNFSTDTNLKLRFSENIIQFDTVFSSIGSSTHNFKIYNPNNNSLTIQSIELINAANSGFRINIDGEKGIRFANIDILKNDSLFGFVEITVNPSDRNSPVYIKDSIRFITNGNVQYIYLEAIGQDVHIWKGRIISEDTVLTGEKPYLIYDSLRVNSLATLSLKENVRFYFHNKASIQVYGKLNIEGSTQNPVIFRGDRFDNIENNIPYNNVPGQWEGVFFYNSSQGNIIKNARIQNSIKGVMIDGDRSMAISNTIIHNNTNAGLSVIDGNITAINCQFSNSAGSCVKLVSGTYNFLHCTFANYYEWGYRNGATLSISNEGGYSIDCTIINSIIYGTSKNEINLAQQTNTNYSYKFIKCLIKKESADNNFISTILNLDPLFKNLDTDNNYSYNFALQKGSPAIGQGSKDYVQYAPTDIIGNIRSTDHPDIGCYEYQ